jgi:protocatechuate 3,4-dioxygenase beta subunit
MMPLAFTLIAALLMQQGIPRRRVMADPATGQNFTQPDGQMMFKNPSAQPAYTGPKGSISGTVLDAATNTPVKKAQVRIVNSGLQTVAVTDASGTFTFEQLPPGSYGVVANHPAYPTNPGLQMQPPITLAPGEQKRGADVKLTPGATVSGHITDEDGDPVANCNVSLFTRNTNQNFQPTHRANTDSAGDYTMAALPTGKYYLEARCNAPYLQPRAFAPPGSPRHGFPDVAAKGHHCLRSRHRRGGRTR